MEIKRSVSSYVKKAVVLPKEKIAADVIKYGISNENAAKCIEKNNTLVFACDRKATKPEIKAAIVTLYGANVIKVRTSISMKGYKKAFVVLKNEGEAIKVANEAGIL